MNENKKEEKEVPLLEKPGNPTEESILTIEQAILKAETLEGQAEPLNDARQILINSICQICNIEEIEKSKKISNILEKAASAINGRRVSAILILRAMAINGLLPFESDHQLSRRVVDLIEGNFSDQLRRLRLNEKRQTFEKIDLMRGYHSSICQELMPLMSAGQTLADIAALTPDITKIVRNGTLGAYLQPYRWTQLKALLSQLCELAINLNACTDSSYKQRFTELENKSDELASECNQLPSFLSKYIKAFIESVSNSLQTLRKDSRNSFSTDLEPQRRIPEVAAKRYPLHIVNKFITITLPFVNKGPGVAVNVQVELDTGSNSGFALEEEFLHLGDVPPGEFALSFRGMVVQEMDSCNLALQLQWSEFFGEMKSEAISVRLLSQDPNVDWKSLQQFEPYSLDVADGERFVGRQAKVQSICNRLIRAQMSSTYITGQKRIGKTSLAQAVERSLEQASEITTKYRTLYLEWGEYSNADAGKTVEVLGETIFQFLCSYLPPHINPPIANFSGSIAALNTIARLLDQVCPNDKFVLILDEFDEIHPEMYRYGALAEAFFSNLRTLSAKRNIAFILVGGEKMPFIIGAQGDQLNKFSREPLDYFSRSEEWDDYVKLVRDPVRGKVNWQDNAINELFTETAGHPYYTKLICSKVLFNAVNERDTEVIASDVRKAISDCVSELDINSFAHFWKDGISEEREEAQVIELKRLRVLVAFGRAHRDGPVTRETLHVAYKELSLDDSSVRPIIDDFLRRDIFRESGKVLTTSLPLFQRWVADVGVTKLITSTLADEIAQELTKADDAAYVTSGELIDLVRNWPLYRANSITAESVRAWLAQVPSIQEQRLLYTLLKNLRFVTPSQIAELLSLARRTVSEVAPTPVRFNKNERRRDLTVTYLDGPAKSGAYFARAYAKEAGILMDCVIEPSRILKRLESEVSPPSAILIIDDLAATGKTISVGIKEFIEPISDKLQETNTPIVIILLFASAEAFTRIEKAVSQFQNIKIKIYVCEELREEAYAFSHASLNFWKNETEKDKAKALCLRLGTHLYKPPLGFGSQALLIAFPEGCPNNSLPILFASSAGPQPWTALLPRPSS